MAKNTYDIVKHQNGEKFARALRDNNLLDIPNIADIVKYAGRDSNPELMTYLWTHKIIKKTTPTSTDDPFNLLHRAGYSFVEYADTLKKQNAIKKYFRENEELCTFSDDCRYRKYYIVNAVKYNAETIQPAYPPEREDEYGTSVISIQMQKTGGYISIKNRYNHSVENPDNTFDSDPDNIIPGLSAALKVYFNVNWDATGVSLPNGYIRIGKRIMKYNYALYGMHIGENCYEKNGHIFDIDKGYQTIIDYFLWDSRRHVLINLSDGQDAFVNAFNDAAANKKVTLSGRVPNQTIMINGEKIIEIQNGKIIWLHMPEVRKVGHSFLAHNRDLAYLSMPNLEKAGFNFLARNTELQEVDLPRLENAPDNFLKNNTQIYRLNMPRMRVAKNNFLLSNTELAEINAPMLEQIGDNFLGSNYKASRVFMPHIKRIGHNFMPHNNELHSINFPSLETVGNAFLMANTTINTVNLPVLRSVSDSFLGNNRRLTSLSLPELKTAGDQFIYLYSNIQSLNLPMLERAGDDFLAHNICLENINAPKLRRLGRNSLQYNKKMHDMLAQNRLSPLKNATLKIKENIVTILQRYGDRPKE